MNRTNRQNEIWFVDNIQPHREHLKNWLKGKFPEIQDLDDVIQETMFRVVRAYASGPIFNPKAYLFFTARNLVLSRIRSHKFEILPLSQEFDFNEIMKSEEEDPFELTSKREEMDLLIGALQSLPKRCRQVLTLRKVYGYSLRETALKLGITVSTVGSLTAVGIEKCEAYLKKQKFGEY